jgi:hypothetical protein
VPPLENISLLDWVSEERPMHVYSTTHWFLSSRDGMCVVGLVGFGGTVALTAHIYDMPIGGGLCFNMALPNLPSVFSNATEQSQHT